MPEGYVIPPAGVSPAGFFTGAEVVSPAQPPAILADDIDPATGEYRTILSGIHPVDAAVGEAFRLQKGTGAAVADDGHEFRKIRKIGSSTPRELRDEALRTLKALIDRGDVAAVDIVTEAGTPVTGNDVGAVYVAYTNLRTRKNGQVPIGSIKS